MSRPTWESVYPACRRLVPSALWQRCTTGNDPARLPALLQKSTDAELPAFLPDLARLEWARHEVRNNAAAIAPVSSLSLNPTCR